MVKTLSTARELVEEFESLRKSLINMAGEIKLLAIADRYESADEMRDALQKIETIIDREFPEVFERKDTEEAQNMKEGTVTITKVTQRVGHDSMWIKGVLPSGAFVKFSISRNGEKLEAGLSNSEAFNKLLFARLKEWLAPREKEDNLQRFERLSNLLQASMNSADIMNILNSKKY